MGIMARLAENNVAAIVKTTKHVTISVEYVLMVVKTVTLEINVTYHATKGIMVQTVLYYAPPPVKHVDTQMVIVPLAKEHIMAISVHWSVFQTVKLTHVNKRIVCAHVLKVGWGTIAQKNVFSPMGKIAVRNVVKTVSIKHVME